MSGPSPFLFWGCPIAAAVPSIEPTIAAAGDTWTWTKSFTDYPASDSWVLAYAFRGVSRLDWDTGYVTTSGDTYTIVIPATATAELTAGTYKWVATVTKSAERYTAASGVMTVEPDLTEFAEGDGQSHSEKMVKLIEAALQERLTGVADGGRGSVENYSVEGRQVSLMTTLELEQLRAKYKQAVWRERHPGVASRQILVAFSKVR